MAWCFADAGLQSDSLAMFPQPRGAGSQVLTMLRLGGDTGETEVLEEFVQKTRLMLFQKINHGLHRGLCNKLLPESKAKSETTDGTDCADVRECFLSFESWSASICVGGFLQLETGFIRAIRVIRG
jgi:hypothetical protein